MRRAAFGFLVWWLLAASLQAAVATCLWDANTDGVTVGYRVFYGLAPGDTTTGSVDAGNTTTATVQNLTPGIRYYFVVRAYNAAGDLGPPSNEVSLVLAGQGECDYPLGAKAVSIFPTKLTKTGSGGPGSKAYVQFQAASPNSPIQHLGLKTQGVEIAAQDGAPPAYLTSGGVLWFSIPAASGTYPLSIVATNVAGCLRDQATGFTVTVP
jgi:hypothetical protein